MSNPPTRRLLPMTAWPELDRKLWQAASKGTYFATLEPPYIQLVVESYGRWLSRLAESDNLDGDMPPADRVTSKSVQTYVESLRNLGNKHSTVVARLCHLKAALQILAPERNYTWLHPRKLLQAEAGTTLSVKVNQDQLRGWPPSDQRLWRAGLKVGNILMGPRYAANFQPATIETIASGYRRWLVFLRDADRLDLEVPPAKRVTPENAEHYLWALARDQLNTSIIARFSELRAALRIMQPKTDFHWLTSPGGRSLSSWLPATKRAMQVPNSEVLYEWGHTMMQEALVEANPEQRRISYRNGLIIAVFASRAPRVRSMASLRLGSTVIRNGLSYRLVFEKEDVKTGRCIEYDAPVGLSCAIDRYLAVERVELLSGKTHDCLWADKYGAPLSADNISDMIQRQSKACLGFAFGPHRFRHALGTTAPLKDPSHPGVAAAILGISGRMVEEHYNRASQADVADRFHAALSKERGDLKSLAQREFRRQRAQTSSCDPVKDAQRDALGARRGRRTSRSGG